MTSKGLEGIRSIKDIELKGKRVFLRLDLNVPLDNGKIVDDLRIRAALPTISYALEKGANLILCSHLGRPKSANDKDCSLLPVAERLQELLGLEVLLVEDPASEAPKGLIPELRSKKLILLENIRFLKGETSNDMELAVKLADYVDVYINDAFGASHRAHASIVALPSLIKEKGIGFLIEKEITMLDKILHSAEKPFVAVLGGSKVSDKIGLIENLLEKVDSFIIGGAMAYTFLAAKGYPIGSSRIENEKISLAKELINRIEARDKKILLPVDHVIVESLKENANFKNTTSEVVPDSWMAVDIGEKTQAIFAKEILSGKTIFWNGPMGVYEVSPFEKGSFAVANACAQSTGFSIIGGGDSAAVVKLAKLEDKVDHISTGGGASLEYLQGDKLPGILALR